MELLASAEFVGDRGLNLAIGDHDIPFQRLPDGVGDLGVGPLRAADWLHDEIVGDVQDAGHPMGRFLGSA